MNRLTITIQRDLKDKTWYQIHKAAYRKQGARIELRLAWSPTNLTSQYVDHQGRTVDT
jgi:hypothetical protein